MSKKKKVHGAIKHKHPMFIWDVVFCSQLFTTRGKFYSTDMDDVNCGNCKRTEKFEEAK